METFSEAAPPALVVVRIADLESSGLAVVAARALLELPASFQSCGAWRDALVVDEIAALGSSKQRRRLVSTMAQFEKLATQKIVKEGVVFGLIAARLDSTYQVELGAALWSLPKALDLLSAYIR